MTVNTRRVTLGLVAALAVLAALVAMPGRAHAETDDTTPLHRVATKAADWRPIVRAARNARDQRLDRCERQRCKAKARRAFRATRAYAKAPTTWRRTATEARWNVCQPITWSTSTNVALVAEAFRQVGAAAGATFVRASAPAAADVVIEWTTDMMMPGNAGQTDLDGFVVNSRPLVATHATVKIRPDSATLPTVLHELGHVMGLGHVNDSRQIMNEWGQNFPLNVIVGVANIRSLDRLQSGDKAGLWAVGRGGGCLTSAPAAPVPAPMQPDDGGCFPPSTPCAPTASR